MERVNHLKWKLSDENSKKKQIEILNMCNKVQINSDNFSSAESENEEQNVNENHEHDGNISFKKK